MKGGTFTASTSNGFPQTHERGQAYLAIGRSFAEERRFPKAAAEVQKLLEVYPRAPEVPEAIWRLSLAFVELRFCSDARALLGDLVKRYPKSAVARDAQKEIRTLTKRQIRLHQLTRGRSCARERAASSLTKVPARYCSLGARTPGGGAPEHDVRERRRSDPDGQDRLCGEGDGARGVPECALDRRQDRVHADGERQQARQAVPPPRSQREESGREESVEDDPRPLERRVWKPAARLGRREQDGPGDEQHASSAHDDRRPAERASAIRSAEAAASEGGQHVDHGPRRRRLFREGEEDPNPSGRAAAWP